jgi:hypothetical protein
MHAQMVPDYITDILRRLKIFEQNLYFKYTEYSSNPSSYNESVLLVHKAIERLSERRDETQSSIEETEWTQLLLRRLSRTLTVGEQLCKHVSQWNTTTSCEDVEEIFILKLLHVEIWQPYLNDCQCILKGYPPQEYTQAWTSIQRVKQFEDKLEQRKLDFESTHGKRKSFGELCEENRIFFTEYLEKCIFFHSTVPVRGLGTGENVEHFIQQIFGTSVTSESKISAQQFLNKIEVPLRLSAGRMRKTKIWLSSRTHSSTDQFIPSVNEATVENDSSVINDKTVLSILQNRRWSLILGDPGCGKTSMLRWITFQFAHFLLQGKTSPMTIEGVNEWEQLAAYSALKNLTVGHARVPILIRIGEFATWLDSHPFSTLVDYIGCHTWFGNIYSKCEETASVLKQFLLHGHALVLFDGLDEVSDYKQRHKIVNLIESFLAIYVRSSAYVSINDDKDIVRDWGEFNCAYAEIGGGNQVIITSRSIGYHVLPLKGNMLEIFCLQPMDRNEFELLLNHCLFYVHYNIVRGANWLDITPLSEEKANIIRKQKDTKVKEILDRESEKIWSHPMLFSMIFPILYKMTENIELTSRVALYESTVRSVINTWTLFHETLSSELVKWILRDMAAYIHQNCPSGLIDRFDLTRLLLISLKAFHKHENIADISGKRLLAQSKELIDLLNSNIGFVAARGLEAYGFVHRTFQEYFVALRIIEPFVDEIKMYPSSMINPLFACITKRNFYEPLTLAIDWIQSICNDDNFDVFCVALMKQYTGALPTGALLLLNVLEELSTRPPRHVLYQLFDCLLSTYPDLILLESLRCGLSKMTEVPSFIKEFFDQTTNREALCRLLLYSLDYEDRDHWSPPPWLSKSIYTDLDYFLDNNEEIETIIDFALRSQIDTSADILDVSRSNSLSMFLLEKTIVASDIHPAVLSVIIALCGGLYCQQIDAEHVSRAQFDSTRMHRSTPLSHLLITYFIDYFTDPVRGVQFLIQKCEEIIFIASTNDVSRKVTDAIITLICLQGVRETLVYERLRSYKALYRALYRFKLILYHLRQVYVSERDFTYKFSFPWDDAIDFLEKLVIDLQTSVTGIGQTVRVIITSLNRMAHPIFQHRPIPFSINENTDIIRATASFSSRFLWNISTHPLIIKEGDSEKWRRGYIPYQLFHGLELFPVEFISPHLRPLFERLVSTKRLNYGQNTCDPEHIPVVTLLAELFLTVYDHLSAGTFLESLCLLFDIDRDVHEQRMESYSIALVQIAKRNMKMNIEYIPEYLKDFIFTQTEDKIRIAVEKEQQRIYSTLCSTDQEKIDLQLYTASMGLARLCELTSIKQKELFEEAKRAGHAIQNCTMRVLCLCHLREIVHSWIDTTLYYALQVEILETVRHLPQNLSLLISALVFAYSQAEGEHCHPSLSQLSTIVWSQLNCTPKNEDEARDQEAACQAVRDRFDWQIPVSLLTRSQLSDTFLLNSTVFNAYFKSKVSRNYPHSVLLSQMYLAELAIDAQILTVFTNTSVALKPILYIKEQFKQLWRLFDQSLSRSAALILRHREVMFINGFLQSKLEDIIHIPFEDNLTNCIGFEDRDRPMIESWLQYHDDENRCQFAIFAILLLFRCGKEMTPTVSATVEMILDKALLSKHDRFRQGARVCVALTSHMTDLAWNPPLLRILTKLCVDSGGNKFTRFNITSIVNMDEVLELEYQRLTVQRTDDEYTHLSCLDLIEQCSDHVIPYITTRLRDLCVIVNLANDKYLATVLLHLVRKIKKNQWNEHLYELITSLMYNSHLPHTQVAAVYTLEAQERGRDILYNRLLSHYGKNSSVEETGENKFLLLDDDVLDACLWALSDSKVDGRRSEHPQFQNDFWEVWRRSDWAAACFLSHTLRAKECFEKLQVRLSMNVHYLYKLFLMNTSYVTEWEEREDWAKNLCELLEHYWSELRQVFITDFYDFLCINPNMTVSRLKPRPSFYKIAERFINVKPILLSKAMCVFGEEKFKEAIYKVSKKCTAAQRMICLKIYSLFQVATVEFIDMAFRACLDDFTLRQRAVLNCFNNVLEVEDRETIETVSAYLKSPSMFQRYLAAKCLEKFVLLGFLTATEVNKLLDDVLRDPTSTGVLALWREPRGKSLDTYIRSLLLSMTCLESIDDDRTSLSVLTPEKINVEFSASLEVPRYTLFTI